MSKSKFSELSREDLLRRCLEQEDELDKLRPKPPKFRLGQLLIREGPNAYYRGQPHTAFVVLSVEQRAGKWCYGYSRASTHSFNLFPEEKCRLVTQADIDGPSVSVQAPQATMVLPNYSETTAPEPDWNALEDA